MISVIVPVYNVENYIRRCIDSIINQTYSDLEVILINDGSNDMSGSICDEYEQMDSRVRVFHQENKGVAFTRNLGVYLSNGEYIAFVDSDDYIHPDMMKTLYEHIIINDADMAICGYERLDQELNYLPGQRDQFDRDKIVDADEALNHLFRDGKMCVLWNKLYNRNIFVGIRFPDGKINEDDYVMHEIIGACKRIALISQCMYYYIQSSNSIMRSKITIRRLDGIEAYYRRAIFLEKRNNKRLLPDITRYMLSLYLWLREEIEVCSLQDRRRFRDVKKMVRYCIIRYGVNIELKEIITFELPEILSLIKHIRNMNRLKKD